LRIALPPLALTRENRRFAVPRTAIATICLGDSYRASWENYCKKNWEIYAHRHGFDLVMFSSPLDTSKRAASRSPAWQKLLVLESLDKYERVVWLDSDIVINVGAPSVIEAVPLGKVGAVMSGDAMHPDLRPISLARVLKVPHHEAILPGAWEQVQAAYYKRAGVASRWTDVLQTGVLVIDHSHRKLLRTVYETYPDELLHYEQFPLSVAVLEARLHHPINSRFNMLFGDDAAIHYPYIFDRRFSANADLAKLAVLTALSNAYFLHFADIKHYIMWTAFIGNWDASPTAQQLAAWSQLNNYPPA
jgi:hypothetical protein